MARGGCILSPPSFSGWRFSADRPARGLRILTQRVEVDAKESRIMQLKAYSCARWPLFKRGPPALACPVLYPSGAPVRIKLRTRMLLKLQYDCPPLKVRFRLRSASWPATRQRRLEEAHVSVVKSGKAQNEHIMSAPPPKADIDRRDRHVRFVPKADSCSAANPHSYSITSMAHARSAVALADREAGITSGDLQGIGDLFTVLRHQGLIAGRSVLAFDKPAFADPFAERRTKPVEASADPPLINAISGSAPCCARVET